MASKVMLVDATRKELEQKSALFEIITSTTGYPMSGDWSISAEYANRWYLLSCKETGDKIKYGPVSGVIVDIIQKRIVCPTGYHQEIVLANPRLPLTASGRTMMFMDGTVADFDDVKIYPGYEGFLIRAWKDTEGQTHLSTMKHFDLRESECRRETSPLFSDLYTQFGGPDPDTLYDPKKKYSPFVHSFLLCSKHTTTVSKHPADFDEILIYLGADRSGLSDTSPEETEQIPTKPKTTTDRSVAIRDRIPFEPTPFARVEDINSFLNTGYGSHPLLGESVLMYHRDGSKYRVLSPAYLWRLTIRTELNLQFNFTSLLTRARKDDTTLRLPLPDSGGYPDSSDEDILRTIKAGQPVLPAIGPKSSLITKPTRTAWFALLYALPQSLLLDAYPILNTFNQQMLMVESQIIKYIRGEIKCKGRNDTLEGLAIKHGGEPPHTLACNIKRIVREMQPREVHRLAKYFSKNSA